MKTAPDSGRDFIDVVEPFVVQAPQTGHEIQFFGGIGSYVLGLPTTEIDVDEKVIYVSEKDARGLKQFRDDGTLRDLDMLVLTTDKAVTEDIEAKAKAAINTTQTKNGKTVEKEEAEISVFGLHDMSELDAQRRRTIASLLSYWVSDRYVVMEEGKILVAKKAGYPLAVDMPPSSMDPFDLHIGNRFVMKTSNPAATVLNYHSRSISGPRPKDNRPSKKDGKRKVDELVRNVHAKAPELIDWIVDGDGSSQHHLARAYRTLAAPDEPPLVFGDVLEVAPYATPQEIFDHVEVLVSPERLLMAMFVTELKARGLHTAETNEKLVTLWQEHLEKYADAITKSRAPQDIVGNMRIRQKLGALAGRALSSKDR